MFPSVSRQYFFGSTLLSIIFWWKLNIWGWPAIRILGSLFFFSPAVQVIGFQKFPFEKTILVLAIAGVVKNFACVIWRQKCPSQLQDMLINVCCAEASLETGSPLIPGFVSSCLSFCFYHLLWDWGLCWGVFCRRAFTVRRQEEAEMASWGGLQSYRSRTDEKPLNHLVPLFTHLWNGHSDTGQTHLS